MVEDIAEDLPIAWPIAVEPVDVPGRRDPDVPGTPELERELQRVLSSPDVARAMQCIAWKRSSWAEWEDVWQEAALQLVRLVRRTHNPALGSVRAHVLRKMTFVCMDAARAARSARSPVFDRPDLHVALSEPGVPPLADDGATTPHDRLEAEERRVALHAAFELLDPEHQAVLRAQLTGQDEDLTVPQQAARVGLAPRTWRRRQRHARRELARSLRVQLAVEGSS